MLEVGRDRRGCTIRTEHATYEPDELERAEWEPIKEQLRACSRGYVNELDSMGCPTLEQSR